MAITSFNKVWRGEVSDRLMGGEKQFSTLYRAISSDGITDDEAMVRSHPDCPYEGSQIVRGSDTYYAKRVRVERSDDSRIEFMVTVEWSTQVSQDELENQPSREIVPPPERRAVITWGSREFTLAIWADNLNRAILNTANDPPDPVPERPLSILTANISKNVLSAPPWLREALGSINNSSFNLDGLPWQAGDARFSGLRIGPRQRWRDIEYRQLDITIDFMKPLQTANVYDGISRQAYEPKGWDLILLNEGMNELYYIPNSNGQTGKRRILDSDGEPVVKPVCLDRQGAKLVDPSPSTAIYLRWAVHTPFDFNQLPLT